MKDAGRAGHRRHLTSVMVFAALAFAALAGSMLYLGRFGVGPNCIYYADFGYAAGLERGAPIKVSGIRVGRIAALELLTPNATPCAALAMPHMGQQAMPVVRATLQVRHDVQPFVTQHSQWSVVTTGIIGDAYLELSPAAGTPLPERAALRGIDAPHLHEIALASETVLHHLAPLFEPTMLADDAAAPWASGSPAARLVQTLAHMLVAHEHDVGTMLHEGADAAVEIRQVAAAVHAAVGDGESLKDTWARLHQLVRQLEHDYPDLLTHAAATLRHVHALSERADAQLGQTQLDAIVSDAAQTLAHLASLAQTADAIADDMKCGKGSLGGALRDPTLFDDLRALVHELRAHPYKLLWRR